MQEKHTLMFVASDINTVRVCHRLRMKATLNIDVFGLPLTNKYYSIVFLDQWRRHAVDVASC
jgi:hypothetical protein